MSDDLRWELLDRYFAGLCTPAEAMVIQRWVDGDADNQREIDFLRRIWTTTGELPRRRSVTAGWIRVTNALPLEESRYVERQVSRNLQERFVSSHGVAFYVTRIAAVLVVATLGVALWTRSNVHESPSSVASVTTREYVTPRGQYATILLGDGTHITLAPDSRLRTVFDADSQVRDVYLNGQALFDVKHDSVRPFRVHAARAIATDLGTTFVVRAYADTPQVEVVVVEGIVSMTATPVGSPPVPLTLSAHRVSVPRDTLLLRQGDLGRVTTSGDLHEEHVVAINRYTAWAQGRLVFRDTPLREVAADLSRWYDLDVQVTDGALTNLRVTASFGNESASRVFRLIALSLGLHYSRDGQLVTFYRAER